MARQWVLVLLLGGLNPSHSNTCLDISTPSDGTLMYTFFTNMPSIVGIQTLVSSIPIIVDESRSQGRPS